MERRLEIDAARGAMLVWMTLTHMPTMLTPWVNQPIGYISASDGFIFLSALFTGRIYVRVLDRSGVQAMSSKLLLRTLRLYRYHVLLLFAAFVVAAHFAVTGNHPNLYYLLDFYFSAGPARAIRDALLLVYRPPLLDIIPLYLIFLLLSPLALIVADKIGWRLILGTSFTIWLLAQFGLRQGLYGFATHHLRLSIPLSEMGAFNPWAWQFMWILGMWCGARWAKNTLPIEKWAQRVWIPAAVIAVTMLAVRYTEIRGLINVTPVGSNALGSFDWSLLFDKWHLGAARLLNFAAVTVLLVRFQSVVKHLAVRPLVLMGQASLQVFCTHFVFCFIGLGLMGSDNRLFGWRQFALLAVTFATLLVVARLCAKHDDAAHTDAAPPAPARPPASPIAVNTSSPVPALAADRAAHLECGTLTPLSPPQRQVDSPTAPALESAFPHSNNPSTSN